MESKPQTREDIRVKERRRKNDWVINMSTALSVVSWFVAISVVFVLEQARPESDTMFSTYFRARGIDIFIRDYWDTRLLPIAFTLLVASLCACIIAFFFNMMRMKRKTDKYKKSIITIGIITIIGIVFFIINFGISMW